MTDSDLRWNEFEATGEIQVRKNLADRIYSEEKTLLAREWLAHTESARRASEFARIDASNREHNITTRSAKNAAWAAAIAAMIAATGAMIAAVCAVIAILAHK
jgi:hypothetical protein